MTIDNKFQNDIMDIFEIDYTYENEPINRVVAKPQVENKNKRLEMLEIEINNIENCKLKNNGNKLVFGDGDLDSKIMIVGEGPGQKEDEIGKPFMGDAGLLLNKMLKAIQLDRNKTYITNVVNFRPPDNRKPDTLEIHRYKYFLIEHISIIDPKILVLMGSTAMEALFGSGMKITKERGRWKELIIKNKTYKTIITFHPAYLLRQPEKKKYSWEDLKAIRKEIYNINLI